MWLQTPRLEQKTMKINGNTIRVGNVIEHNGQLWRAMKTDHVKPGKGGAFAQIELRDIRNGTKTNERFRADEKVERITLEQKPMAYLFEDGGLLTFMDNETFDQIQLSKELLGEQAVYLQISQQLTELITSGRLGPGTKLPGTRKMSELLGVNRNTIIAAYAELDMQGWLDTRNSSGTYVNKQLPVITNSAAPANYAETESLASVPTDVPYDLNLK